MSSATDFLARFGGTVGNPDGGESLVKDLFKRVITVNTKALVADTSARDVVWKNPMTGVSLRLVDAEYIPDVAVTAHDTNFTVLNVYHVVTPASGTDKLAATASTTTTGTGNLVADTPEDLNLSATEANKILAPGEYIVWLTDGATNGTGVALPVGHLVLTYEVV
jgi:hypothetical protein